MFIRRSGGRICISSFMAASASAWVMSLYSTMERRVMSRFLIARSRCLNGVNAFGALMIPASMADSARVSWAADFSK